MNVTLEFIVLDSAPEAAASAVRRKNEPLSIEITDENERLGFLGFLC